MKNKKNTTKSYFLAFLTSFILCITPALHAQQSNTPRVDSFTLVNADTGEDLAVYANVSGASTGSVPIGSASRISLRFNTSNTRSVRISGISAQPRVENQQPYSLLGDDGTIDGGTIYNPWSPSVGVHSITVAPFAGGNTSGEQGASATLRFTVTDAVVVPNPPPSPRPGSSALAAKVMPPINYLLLSDDDDGLSADVEDVCAAWDSTFPTNAFTVTEDDRLNLQELLETHDVLRLTPGDYRTNGLNKVTIDSNQSIIALSPTRFPDVDVAAGANHVRLEGLQQLDIGFIPGRSIRYSCFKNLRAASIIVDGATVERNLFVAIANTNIEVDTSQSGHFSDNRFIKLNSHGNVMPISIKGDATRSSGGNAFLLVDAQTPPGSAFAVASQSDISFVGVDLESYNWRGNETHPYAFQVRNTGTFRAINSSGMNRRHDPNQNPAYDIDAEQIFLTQFNAPSPKPVLRVGPSNDFLFSWRNQLSSTLIQDDTTNSNALHVYAQEDIGAGFQSDVSFSIDGTRLTAEPSASTANALRTALTQTDAGTAPWGIPEFGRIPNPTGANWDANLDQQVDESAAIQQMIDDNGIAYLEPRTYYVGSSIIIDKDQGIVGAGANKTAIVALSNDIDIINLAWTGVPECNTLTGGFSLAEITLQGGRNGIVSNTAGTQINRSTISHVTFRNMANAGILVDGVFGWDNNVMDHVNFADSAYGFMQIGGTNPGDSCYPVNSEWPTMSYMDKTVFYRSQFLRLGSAVVLRPTRANNLNGIVESLFKDNTTNAIALRGGNAGLMIASSRFVNNAGDPVVGGNFDTTVVNSFFEAGQGSSMLNTSVTVEGSTFTAGTSTNAVVFGQPRLNEVRNPRFFDVYNSVLEIPLGPVDSTTPVAGMYFNNNRIAGDSLGEFLNVIEYVTNGDTNRLNHSRTVLPLLRGQSSPGSQLLRGGSWSR